MLDQIVSLISLNGTFDLGHMFQSRRVELEKLGRKPSDFKMYCKTVSLCISTYKLLVYDLWRCPSENRIFKQGQ